MQKKFFETDAYRVRCGAIMVILYPFVGALIGRQLGILNLSWLTSEAQRYTNGEEGGMHLANRGDVTG